MPHAAATLARRLAAVPAATLLAAAAIGISGVLLLALTGPLTFLLDDWAFLVYRRGFTEQAILEPHNEHIVIGPILVYKGLLELFGMESARPFQVAAMLAFLTGAAVLFAYLRARVNVWLALAATVAVLFMGPAWENLLWSFQIGMLCSMASGLGMLLALERRDRGGDRLACALLVLSVSFSSLGLAFAAGAAVAIGLEPGRRRRAYVVAIPAALFAIWWLIWGHHADSVITIDNLLAAPGYVFDGFASSVASLAGLASPHDAIEPEPLVLGRPLLVVLVALAGWRLYRLGRVPAGLWVVGTVALVFWGLAALNAMEARPPTNSRYQFVGVIAVVLIAAELLRGVQPGRGALAVVLAITGLAVASNLAYLREAQRTLEGTSDLIRADLGAVEIARDTVDPNMFLTADIAGTIAVGIPAGPYLSAAEAFGSPADDPREIAVASEPAREAADKVLMRALGLTFTPLQRRPASSRCRRLVAPPDGSGTVVELPPGGALVVGAAGGATQLRLRRFAAESFPIEGGTLAAGEAGELAIPPDRADEPWEALLSAPGTVRVCPRSP